MDTILLIADEDQRVKNIVRFTFEQMDYKVLSTSSGADAIWKTKETKPDIVLVDVSLSDKNGYEVSREIKSNPILKDTPVVLLISSFVTFNKTKVAECLADDFIIKPFVFEEIIQKVKSLTTSSNNHKNKLPKTVQTVRKETFAKSALALFFILIIFTVFSLFTRSSPPTPKGESSHAFSSRKSSNDLKIDKASTVKSNSAYLSKKAQEINITISKNEEIYINGASFTLSTIKPEIYKLAANFGKKIEDQVVFLRADDTVPYGNVMKVAAEIKKSGVKKLELDSEPVLFSESKHVDYIETSRENSQTYADNKLMSSRELPKIKVVKQEKPKVEYAVSAGVAKENGEKTTNISALAETSAILSTKETENKQVTSKKSINRNVGESKEKAEEKKNYAEKQTTTSQTAIKEVKDKLKKTTSRTRKEIPKNIRTSTKKQPEVKVNKYVVKKGETLWSISRKFNTTVESLKMVNKLMSDRVNSGKVLIVPEVEQQPRSKTLTSKRNKSQNFSKDIRITDWKLYVAWGMPTIHNVTIENTSGTTYSNIKIKAQYYSSHSTDLVKLEIAEVEGTLPVSVPPYTKKTYLQNGFQLRQGSSCGMFGGVKDIKIIAANPVDKDTNLYSSR